MRRPLIVLWSVLAVIVVTVGASVVSSSAAQRVVVCPQVRGLLIPCCGPPMSAAQQAPPNDVQPINCCPANVLCAPKPTIGSSPNPSTASDSVVISGKMLAAAAGTQIELWQRVPGQSDFKQLTHTSTDSSGGYSITRAAGRVQTNRQWYVTAGPMRSTTISQQVHALVKLAVRIDGPRAATLIGTISPNHARERVTVERRSGTTWKPIAHPRLNRHSRFSLKLVVKPGHVTTFRAILPADARNVLSTSRAITIGGAAGS